MKDEPINLYKPLEERFLYELSDRLDSLKRYFEKKFYPLKPNFEILPLENSPNISVEFWLEGKYRYRASMTLSIFRGALQMRDEAGALAHHIENLKNSIEDEVTRKGILWLNEAK